MKRLLLCAMLLVLSSAAGKVLGATYDIIDLGFLGAGKAMDINNSGQVVGISYSHAFLWTNGQMTDLGTLGGWSSQAWGINNSGQVIGVGSISGGVVAPWHAFRTAPNQPINPATDDLGTLGGRDSYGAYAINNSGQVVGDSFTSGDDFAPWHAFRTAPNQPINPATDDLGTLGGLSSGGGAINDSGQVVGSAQTSGGDLAPWHAFRTAPNQPINPATDDLGTLPGTTDSSACDINNSGQVVGLANDSSGDYMRAFLYSGNGPMQDLNDLIAPASGWILQEALGINDSGQIVGNGVIGGQQHGFLLTPIPEPSTLAQLAIAAGLMTYAWRRRR